MERPGRTETFSHRLDKVRVSNRFVGEIGFFFTFFSFLFICRDGDINTNLDTQQKITPRSSCDAIPIFYTN